jgi:thiosulfate sulfurtransferase|tara:strand:- start:4882 stop:5193 length:312 start_codon:yes stop_codon:yes gene_type:complete
MIENNNFIKIELKEAKSLMEDEGLLLFDVRDENSFDQSHMKNAINLNNQNIDDIVKKTEHKKSILIYCYKGISSQNVAQHFCNLGFENVYSLNGGYEGFFEDE